MNLYLFNRFHDELLRLEINPWQTECGAGAMYIYPGHKYTCTHSVFL